MSRHSNYFSAFVSIFALAIAAVANAETVELLNGDIVHGKVLSLDAQVLKLQSESFGELSIKRETVATIHLHDRGLQSKQTKVPAKQPKPFNKVPTAEEVLQQLRTEGGIGAEEMKAVQQKLPLLAMPEVKSFVGERLSGLLSGRLNIGDIRKEAIDAVDQIKDLQKDLGPQASALNGYLSILENFIQQTEPESSNSQSSNSQELEAAKQEQPKN